MTNTEHELTTVLVEDERMFSEMLARSLTSVSGLSLVARAFNVEQGVEACQKHAPDLLILDLALPDGNGIDVLKALKKIRPEALAVVLSAHADDFVTPPEVESQVSAVISKGDAHESLSMHLRDLVQKQNPGFEDEQVLIDRLTPREQDIFDLLGAGLTNREIAKRLSRSAATVATHRKMIAVKLRCSGAALMSVAARYRTQHGKIPS
ncbi:MAG: response regulator transcription factor [Spiribacter sp.]|jgi:DNA-binding NarL/FixJ family response regulator|nr:response regulator transcription factor [Spiribacter sp.]MDR9488709.1 response regulator transcription factor [Spiribacter sp.]